jgi:hypothetical protein
MNFPSFSLNTTAGSPFLFNPKKPLLSITPNKLNLKGLIEEKKMKKLSDRKKIISVDLLCNLALDYLESICNRIILDGFPNIFLLENILK